MPLRDHFQLPLSLLRSWESFHSRLANSIADFLNETLPERFFAEVQTHMGRQVEADVIEFDRPSESEDSADSDAGGGVAIQIWAPPVATLTFPAVFPDDIEVHVRDKLFEANALAVVELVSPGNKDRHEHRLAFSDKCAAYLQRGIGLVTLDIVTDRHFNLHNELVSRLGLGSTHSMSDEAAIYAVAYRPIRRDEKNLIDAWPVELSVGRGLPMLPLSLRRFRPVRLDLDAAYEDACRRSRL
jgi:Protein of unknown function (DUF4058)